MARMISIIVAGGSGERMGAAVPKQFLEVEGLPILMHTILNYTKCLKKAVGITNQTVLVLPEKHHRLWEELCEKYDFRCDLTVVAGGESRFHSVKNAMNFIAREVNPSPCLVSVHDGVRPFVSEETLINALRTVTRHGTAVVSQKPTDSIRILDANNASTPLDREKLRTVQTPQIFRYDIIRKGYEQPFSEFFTDDSSVCQAAGFEIFLSEGNPENIKITTPLDLILARELIRD